MQYLPFMKGTNLKLCSTCSIKRGVLFPFLNVGLHVKIITLKLSVN